jgi:hypothetical protein
MPDNPEQPRYKLWCSTNLACQWTRCCFLTLISYLLCRYMTFRLLEYLLVSSSYQMSSWSCEIRFSFSILPHKTWYNSQI